MNIVDLTREQLQQLRNEIHLNGIFRSDYNNSFDIDNHEVGAFFDGFLDFIITQDNWDKLKLNGGFSMPTSVDDNNFIVVMLGFDNIDNLELYRDYYYN